MGVVGKVVGRVPGATGAVEGVVLGPVGKVAGVVIPGGIMEGVVTVVVTLVTGAVVGTITVCEVGRFVKGGRFKSTSHVSMYDANCSYVRIPLAQSTHNLITLSNLFTW